MPSPCGGPTPARLRWARCAGWARCAAQPRGDRQRAGDPVGCEEPWQERRLGTRRRSSSRAPAGSPRCIASRRTRRTSSSTATARSRARGAGAPNTGDKHWQAERAHGHLETSLVGSARRGPGVHGLVRSCSELQRVAARLGVRGARELGVAQPRVGPSPNTACLLLIVYVGLSTDSGYLDCHVLPFWFCIDLLHHFSGHSVRHCR